jgi:polyketide synthase PksJ
VSSTDEKADLMTEESGVVVIVGMSLRVPGAESTDQYWHNLKNGIESISFFSDDELRAAGVTEETLNNPDYVKAMGKLEDVDRFDARFFDMTPKEAEILDPQHRVLMENVWRALEHAAIDPERYPGRIGLYAGVGFNSYLIHNILKDPDLMESAGAWQLSLNNDKDFAPSRIAYKINLQGPAVSVNTACSTSLVSTVFAAQSLLNYQCDTAIAGGCSIHLPQDQGYFYMKGGTVSPDGHCRPFDADAEGTIDGNGAAVVVLKRLEDALKDNDTIYGVLRGFAVNNDGSLKVGYTAPSVSGQADVILEALEMADLDASQIDYVETHGTGTELGDTVEISALTEAFRESTDASGKCAIGSVKSNIGHLDTAAGIAGLIKTVLAMENDQIPPTCHFKKANPKLELEKTPFYVNNTLIPWPSDGKKNKIAGVSSFGIGGTNAHVIVEQFKRKSHPVQQRNVVLIPITAKSEKALSQYAIELADFIDSRPDKSLYDIAYTLQVGRRHFGFRKFVMVNAEDRSDCAKQLRDLNINDPNYHAQKDNLTNALFDAGQQWLDGKDINWDALAGTYQRISIPGHPFNRERFWVEPKVVSQSAIVQTTSKGVTKDPSIDNWFYLPNWKRSIPLVNEIPPDSRWLIVADSAGLSDSLSEEITTAGASVRAVYHQPEDDKKLIDGRYYIDTTIESSWGWLFSELGQWKPTQIVHLGLFKATSNQKTSDYFAFDGMVALGQALGHHYFSEEISVILLADRLFSDGNSNLADPDKATALGPLRVIAQEYPNIHTRAIDIDEHVNQKLLVHEISDSNGPPTIILRGTGRWIENYEKVSIPKVEKLPARLKENGVYVITGGLGNIGLALAQYLAKTLSARIALIGRSNFPAKNEWESLLGDKKTTPRLRKQLHILQEIESMGAEVHIYESDVSNKKTTEAVFQKIEKELDNINGVIHAAGLVGESSFVTLKDARSEEGRTANYVQFLPKIDGTEVLADILSTRNFDFCLICSSLSPILGGLGFSAYSASNLYADAVVEKYNRRDSGKWISVNWEGWMFDEVNVPGSSGNSSAVELGISPEEGLELFSRIMNVDHLERIITSSGNLNSRIAQWIERQPEAEIIPASSAHERPEYIGTYIAPTSETEIKLVSIWGKLLGINGIGIEDSFFDLGGNSLLLTQLVALIRRNFQAELALSAMFESPTIAAIAAQIEELNGVTADDDNRDEGFL